MHLAPPQDVARHAVAMAMPHAGPVLRARAWTTVEERVLRETYGMPGGPRIAAEKIGRNIYAIYAHARKLGLRGVRYVPERRNGRRYSIEPWIDREIERAYQSPRRGAIAELAARVMRPRGWLKSRALALGIAVARIKEPPWSAEEIALLERLAHHRIETIAQKFRDAGFRRTPTAIAVKRKRLKLSIQDPDHYTACQLAALMGVDVKVVTRWIAREGLRASRRGTLRTAQQGGDMWWIARSDLLRWMRDHAQLIDLRKVDRYWFLDLVLGGASCMTS